MIGNDLMSKQFVFSDLKHTFVIKLNRLIMKKKLTLLLILAVFASASAQFNEQEWQLSFGLNAISDLNEGAPTDGFVFNSVPLALGLQYNLSDNFAIEQSVAFNKFPNDIKDSGPLDKKFYYFSADTSVKYNFGQLFLPRRNRLELTANAGIGFYQVEKMETTINIGGGVLWWLTDDKTYGLRLQTLGKFGKVGANEFIANNYFQHHLQFVIALN